VRYVWILIVIAMAVPVVRAPAISAAATRQAEMIPAGKTLTLADCISLAFRNQPAVRQAAAQVDSGKGAVSQARSNLLPQVSVTSSTDLGGTGQSAGTSLSVGGSQLIYDFGRSRSGLTQAERQLAASVAALSGTKADVILSVKQNYYGLLRTIRLVQVVEEDLKAREEHVAVAQERLKVGFAPKADVLKAAASVASARVNLIAARNNADQTRVDLNTAMGVDVRNNTQIEDTTEPEIPVPDVDQAVDLAIKDRPEMHEAEEQVTAAEAAVKSAETGNLPEFSTSLSDKQNFGGQQAASKDSGGQRTPPKNSWGWTLDLSWHPWDSGLTRGAVTQARAQLVSDQESLYQVRQSVSGDVVASRFSLLAAQEALSAATAEVASAKEDLDSATGRYQAGVGIFLEVLDAQAALLKAQVDELVARYGLSIARAGLAHAVGATAGEGTYK